MEQQAIIERHHKGSFAGHASWAKTVQRIQPFFEWPSLTNDVKEYCTKCEECQRRDLSSKKLPYVGRPPPKQPFVRWHFDFTSMNRRSKNRHALITVDALSRYMVAQPCKTTDATAAVKLFDFLTHEWGVPQEIVTDNGKAFTSQQFKSALDDMKVTHHLTIIRSHGGNGIAEAAIKSLKNIIAKKLDDNDDEPVHWERYLSDSVTAYNTTIHGVLRMSPFAVIVGKPMTTQGDEEFNGVIRHEWTDAYERTVQAQLKANELIVNDPHSSHVKVGDLVWMENPTMQEGRKRNLDPKFPVPGRVTKLTPPKRVTLELCDGRQVETSLEQIRKRE